MRAKHILAEEHQMALLVAAISDYGIFMLDPEGRIASWNPGAERLTGYSAEAIVGKHFSIFYLPDQCEERKSEDVLAHALSEGRYIEEGLRLRRDGSTFWASVLVTPIYDEEHRLVGFAKIVRDVTEKVEALAEAARSNAALEQFAYVAAHDLQEPLRTITNYLDLLASRYSGRLDEKADKYIGAAQSGAERLRVLINDLLRYSRISTRTQEFVEVDCNALVRFVMSDLEQVVAETGATVQIGQLPVVSGDRSQLKHVFQNLIGNAVKYRSDRKLLVEVSAERGGSDWLFAVSDNGIGFDMQYAERIFLLFQRLHGRSDYSGTGIGLALCKRVVERHRGRIWVESEEGKGATFFFTLPAVD